jgi:hypothetical protein
MMEYNEIDRLGIINKQIQKLKVEADLIKDNLKKFCLHGNINKLHGTLYSVTFAEAYRKSVDYKTLCADLKLDDEILGKYTTHNAVYTIKVSV